MKEVEITYTSTAELFVATVDMKKLAFAGGKAKRSVRAGKTHALQWFVRGAPGSRYTIQITKPKGAAFQHSATLDPEAKDAGLHWFRVDPEAGA